MMPEETVQAAIDLKAKALLPVHWAKFTLALHAWDEPANRVLEESERRGQKLITPRIGEAVNLKDTKHKYNAWWQLPL
jgi:L-ascorbate metabolism protein UlaG (beta-lactamase superfamily)